MNIPMLRRAGGVLLVVVWTQIATANALPCVIACLLNTEHEHAEHVHSPIAPAHHSSAPSLSRAGRCDSPQLVLVAALPSHFPASPVIDAPLTDLFTYRPTPDHSVVRRIATPPPRASFIV